MNRSIRIAAFAALAVATSAIPALAQGGHRSFHEGWAWGTEGGPNGRGFVIGSEGPAGVGDYAYSPNPYGPVGPGYDDWRYRSGYAYRSGGDYGYRDYGYAGAYDGGERSASRARVRAEDGSRIRATATGRGARERR
jgi:hypothetical protein